MTEPRFSDDRLAEAIADGKRAEGWVLGHDAAMAVLLDLRDARADQRGQRSLERSTVPTIIDADDLPPGVTK